MRFIKSRFRRIPKVKPAVAETKTAIKAAVKEPNKVLNSIKRGVESAKELRDAISTQDIPGLVRTCAKLAGSRKSPIGSNGLNLQPLEMRQITIMSESTAGFTNSASMYMYRPPRKRIDDAISYCMKRTVETGISSDANLQSTHDFSLLDARPVQNNPNDNQDYSVMTIQKAFDNLLKGQNVKDASEVTNKLAQSSLHIKSLSSEMTIKNLASNGAMIDLYDLVPQHSIGPSTYASATYAAGYMSPAWTFSQGLATDNVLELEGNMGASTLGAKPSNSTLFNRTWKQVKHTRINMSAGATHRHRAIYAINKTVNYPEYAQFSSSGGKFAGWNPVILMVIRGVPSGTDIAAPTNIRVVNNIQLNYESTPDRQSKVIVYNSNT